MGNQEREVFTVGSSLMEGFLEEGASERGMQRRAGLAHSAREESPNQAAQTGFLSFPLLLIPPFSPSLLPPLPLPLLLFLIFFLFFLLSFLLSALNYFIIKD